MTLTLKDRVAEAVEQERILKLHKDGAHLERLLLQAKIVDRKLPPEAIEVQGNEVRFDLDGVAFTVFSRIDVRYDDNGEAIGERELAHLKAQRICSREGCSRIVGYPYANDITQLSDLQILFNEREYGDLRYTECDIGERHGQAHSMETDGIEEDQLEDLPF